MRGATLANKLLALAVVQIVVGENQIETPRCERTSSCRQTRNDRNSVRAQKLSRDLLGEDCVILKIQDVHGRVLG
jgi:hypothetical protein